MDDAADECHRLATGVRAKFGVEPELAGTLAAAEAAIRRQAFDIIFYAHSDWEGGVSFYIDVLNASRFPCQFLFFLSDVKVLFPHFAGRLNAVAKPRIDDLLARADWPYWVADRRSWCSRS